VISILLAPARIPSGGLEVAAGIGADPDVGPCGRNHERPDPREFLTVGDPTAIRRVITERAAVLRPADARRSVGGVFEPRIARRRHRCLSRRRRRHLPRCAHAQPPQERGSKKWTVSTPKRPTPNCWLL